MHYLGFHVIFALMDDPRVLRIITVGLILAALAVVYFLFTGAFSVSKPKVNQPQTNQATASPTPIPVITASPSALPSVVGQNTPSTTASPSAYNTLVNRTNKGGVKTLPETGFPVGMAVVFSISALVSGYSLRKFPR